MLWISVCDRVRSQWFARNHKRALNGQYATVERCNRATLFECANTDMRCIQLCNLGLLPCFSGGCCITSRVAAQVLWISNCCSCVAGRACPLVAHLHMLGTMIMSNWSNQSFILEGSQLAWSRILPQATWGELNLLPSQVGLRSQLYSWSQPPPAAPSSRKVRKL